MLPARDLVQASSSKSSASHPSVDKHWLRDTGLEGKDGRRMPNDDLIDPFRSYHVVPKSRAQKPTPHPDEPRHSKQFKEDLKQSINRFTILDRDYMQRLNYFFSTNSLMRTIYDIGSRSLLGGGIAFEKKHHFTSEMTAKLFENAWEQFVRDLLKSMWLYGFALCITRSDEFLVAVPLVLPLDQLIVRFYQDSYGQRRYAVSRIPDAVTVGLGTGIESSGNSSLSKQMQPGDLEQLIPGVTVFEMSPPLSDGTITSNVASILADFRRYDQLMEQYVRYATYHAVPPIFTRFDIPKNPDARALAEDQAAREAGLAGADGGAGAADGADMLPRIDPQEAMKINAFRQYGLRTMAEAAWVVQEQLARAQMIDSNSAGGIEVHHLPAGRVLDKQQLGREPSYLKDIHRELETRVSAVFGIPADLFGEAKGNRSGNTDHRMVFHDSMRGIRQNVESCLYRMYLHIYGESTLDSYIATHNSYTIQQLQADTNVHVTLPGILPTELLTEWRLMGILDHDVFVSMLARAYSLPRSLFTTAPEVSLKDILKVKPEPAGAASSSKSSTTKKKSTSSRTSAPKHSQSHSSSSSSSGGTKRRIEASAAAFAQDYDPRGLGLKRTRFGDDEYVYSHDDTDDDDSVHNDGSDDEDSSA